MVSQCISYYQSEFCNITFCVEPSPFYHFIPILHNTQICAVCRCEDGNGGRCQMWREGQTVEDLNFRMELQKVRDWKTVTADQVEETPERNGQFLAGSAIVWSEVCKWVIKKTKLLPVSSERDNFVADLIVTTQFKQIRKLHVEMLPLTECTVKMVYSKDFACWKRSCMLLQPEPEPEPGHAPPMVIHFRHGELPLKHLSVVGEECWEGPHHANHHGICHIPPWVLTCLPPNTGTGNPLFLGSSHAAVWCWPQLALVGVRAKKESMWWHWGAVK